MDTAADEKSLDTSGPAPRKSRVGSIKGDVLYTSLTTNSARDIVAAAADDDDDDDEAVEDEPFREAEVGVEGGTVAAL